MNVPFSMGEMTSRVIVDEMVAHMRNVTTAEGDVAEPSTNIQTMSAGGGITSNEESRLTPAVIKAQPVLEKLTSDAPEVTLQTTKWLSGLKLADRLVSNALRVVAHAK